MNIFKKIKELFTYKELNWEDIKEGEVFTGKVGNIICINCKKVSE